MGAGQVKNKFIRRFLVRLHKRAGRVIPFLPLSRSKKSFQHKESRKQEKKNLHSQPYEYNKVFRVFKKH